MTSANAGPRTWLGSRAWRVLVPDCASMAILLVSTVVVFATYDNYAISWDEPIHLAYGDHILDWIKTGGEDDSALRFRRDYLYGGAFDGLGAIARKYSKLDPYDTLHLLGGIIGLLGFLGVWRLGRFLGGPWGGFWSLAFVSLTPVYWGHMFFNPKDAPFAAGYIWGLYYVIRVAAVMPAVPRTLWLKLGLGLAAALCVRIAGLIVVCYLGLAVVAYGVFRWAESGRWLEAGRAWWSMGWRAGCSVLIGWAGMLVFWPWAQLQPVSGPFHSLRNMASFNLHNRKFPFAGEWIRTYEAPWDYLPRLFAMKMPEIVVVALVVGVVLGLYVIVRHTREPTQVQRAFTFVLLGLAIVLPPTYAIVKGSPLYDGVRHFLFLVPPMCVAAGLTVSTLQSALSPASGANPIVDGLRVRGNAARAALSLAVVAIALLCCGRQLAVLRYMHPVEYTWFNAFAGGLPGVEGLYDLDYYGGSYKEAIDRLEAYLWETEPDEFLAKTYTVRGCGPSGILARYMPPNFRYTKGGDFYTGFTRKKCHLMYSNFPTAARVERYGVPLNVVRDLRSATRRSETTDE